jgi:dihydrofolate reductase
MSARLAAIVATDGRRVIGLKGALPWHHPEDLKFFKRTTLGHPVLMGRTTFESIGRPLPGRHNLVLSRTMEPREGITLLRDLAELEAACPGVERVFVIGGARVYTDLLPQCDELFLTQVDGEHEGDAFFPPYENLFELKEVLGRAEGLEFRRYERRRGA